jgi:hypothetical protein
MDWVRLRSKPSYGNSRRMTFARNVEILLYIFRYCIPTNESLFMENPQSSVERWLDSFHHIFVDRLRSESACPVNSWSVTELTEAIGYHAKQRRLKLWAVLMKKWWKNAEPHKVKLHHCDRILRHTYTWNSVKVVHQTCFGVTGYVYRVTCIFHTNFVTSKC